MTTYYDRDWAPVVGATATFEQRSGFLSVTGIAPGQDVEIRIERAGVPFEVNPASEGLCGSVPVVAERVSLFLVPARFDR